ncbi:UTRA domain-containing protein [Actinomadura sp. ATCC 39365]
MDVRTLHEAAQIADPIERARALTKLMAEEQALAEQAARYRRHAISEARERGMTLEQIGAHLGVSPGRIWQMRKGPAAKAPEPIAERAPRVLVQRALPTEPAVRGSVSLFLVEAERQGIRADRRMLYIGLEPASEHVANCLRVEPGTEVVARRKLMLANDVPVRIATSFFRADLFGDTRMAEPEFVRPTLQSALTDLGYRFGHAEENLTARRPTIFEAETLELAADEQIVVQVVRASYSTEGTPIHTLETICAASRHIFPIGQVAGADEF